MDGPKTQKNKFQQKLWNIHVHLNSQLGGIRMKLNDVENPLFHCDLSLNRKHSFAELSSEIFKLESPQLFLDVWSERR